LVVDGAGATQIRVAAGADPALVEKTKTTAVSAFLRALAGGTSFHGSAASRDGRALVVLGESGAGKSTAAATLCATNGFELLADDVAGLEHAGGRWWVLATESAHWLALDGLSKRPVAASRPARDPVELGAVVALRFGEASAPSLLRARGRAAHAVLAAAMQRFERSASGWQSELDALASIARAAPVYELVRPRAVNPEATAAALARALEE
jgi:hypothetical protein